MLLASNSHREHVFPAPRLLSWRRVINVPTEFPCTAADQQSEL